jgi:drug/metabolite transporter (DMT)-like permease
MITSAACFTVNVLLVRGLSNVETAVLFILYRRECAYGRLFRHRKLAARGIVGSAGVYVFYLTIVHLGAGRATFINNTYVIFGAVLAVWMLGEPFHRALAIGSVAALGGLALLTDVFGAGPRANVYDLVAILGALGSAYIVVTIRQLHATEHTSTIFAAQCVYGLILCSIPALLQLETVSLLGWATITIAGVFAGLGQITMTRAFRDLPVAEGSLLQMLVPLGIAIGGVVFFQEHFVTRELIGAALILGGTAFIAVRR